MRKPHIQIMSGTQDLDKRIANSLFLQVQIVTPYNYSKFINSYLFCIYHFKATFRSKLPQLDSNRNRMGLEMKPRTGTAGSGTGIISSHCISKLIIDVTFEGNIKSKQQKRRFFGRNVLQQK